jgi:hypothetical protein
MLSYIIVIYILFSLFCASQNLLLTPTQLSRCIQITVKPLFNELLGD